MKGMWIAAIVLLGSVTAPAYASNSESAPPPEFPRMEALAGKIRARMKRKYALAERWRRDLMDCNFSDMDYLLQKKAVNPNTLVDADSPWGIKEAPAIVAARCESPRPLHLIAGAEGVLLHVSNGRGMTALMESARRHEPGEMRLLARNAPSGYLDRKDKEGWTALMWAAYEQDGRARVLEALIELGANPDLVDKNGDSALVHAIERGRTQNFDPLFEKRDPRKLRADLSRGFQLLQQAIPELCRIAGDRRRQEAAGKSFQPSSREIEREIKDMEKMLEMVRRRLGS